jgi:signal transduction histidine kinase
MTLDSLRRAVDSGDAQHVRRTIWSCAESLREARADAPTALVGALVALATHDSPSVRQAIADASDAFPDDVFDDLHPRLLADADRFVRAAADAAGHRHAKTRQRTTKRKVEEKLVVDALRELESEPLGKGARRLAERAVERGIEVFTAHLAHEVGKAQPAIHRALAKLDADVGKPGMSPALLREQIATVRERSQFAFAMVRRARDYTERGKPVFKDEHLASIVDEARAQLLDRLGPRAAKLALTSDVDPALRIEVDRYALLQALQNVLQNAAEAYEEGAPRLTVRVSATTRRGGSEVVLVVADEGVGISEESRADLFVPFGSHKPGGTGLGLLIVRRSIEEMHGGQLAIESTAGKGTQVIFVLPTKQGRT